MNNENTVYLAGKITGDPEYKQKFEAACLELERAGYIVLNPATLPAAGFEYAAYIRISKAMMDECAQVCFLPDWKDSNGAMYEYGRAAAQGKPFLDLQYKCNTKKWTQSKNAPKMVFADNQEKERSNEPLQTP